MSNALTPSSRRPSCHLQIKWRGKPCAQFVYSIMDTEKLVETALTERGLDEVGEAEEECERRG